jgi:hypothetical protein
VEEFLKELQALLEKHKASINFHCGDGSDTHGIYDEGIEVTVGLWPDEQLYKFKHTWGIDALDVFRRNK